MSSRLYPKWKEALFAGGANSALSGDVQAMLVDADDYPYNDAHDFLDDVPVGARVGTPTSLINKTYTSGIFTANPIILPLVTGDQAEAVILFINTGFENTSRLVCYLDSSSLGGLPVTPSGNNIAITWATDGIFKWIG